MSLLPTRRDPERFNDTGELFVPGEFRSMPHELRALFDPEDPDIEYVADSIKHLKAAGLDVTDPRILSLAVEGGHRRAAEAEDDAGLSSQRRRKRAVQVVEVNEAYVRRLEARSVVYYARIGNRCKIGTTLNLKRRMSAIMPEELLVTERGGPILETERHGHFSAYLSHGREWFRYEGALVEHVNQLQRSR